MRETSVRGPAIDLGEFERRLRGARAPKSRILSESLRGWTMGRTLRRQILTAGFWRRRTILAFRPPS